MNARFLPHLFLVALLLVVTPGCRSEQTAAPSVSDAESEDSAAAEAVSPESGDAELEAIASKSSGETPPQSESNDSETPRSLPMPESSASEPVAKPEPTAALAEMTETEYKEAPETSPDVDAEMGEGSDEYEIDADILAEIEAQREALRRLADTYAAPPGAKQIGKQPDLWVDMKTKRVYIDGYVSMQRGPLEMLACPVGTKEHESVVAVFAKSREVHAALLAIGAQSGEPVQWQPDYQPPTGQTIQIWIAWRPELPSAARESEQSEDDDESENQPTQPRLFVPSDEFEIVDARKWIRDMKTQTELAERWVFAGSEFWSDPEDGIEHYSADAGDMICVSNFRSAMLDVPTQSSADTGNLMFEPFTERVPERGTPIRLILVPMPASEPDAATVSEGGEKNGEKILANEKAPPTPDESILPIAQPNASADAAVSPDA